MATVALVVVLALVAGVTWFLTRDADNDVASDNTEDRSTTESGISAVPETEAPESTSEPSEPSATPTESTPTTEPSDPPTTPSEGPLDVLAPYVNQQCEGQTLVMLASSGVPKDYESSIAAAAGRVPGTKYLRTDRSCGTFNQAIKGKPIYAAYIGPFASMEEACQEQYASRIVGAYVRTLDPDRLGRDICSCLDSPDSLPRLGISNASDGSYDVKTRVVDLQALLYNAGHNRDSIVTGYFQDLTRGMVRDFQRANGLRADGWVGPETWAELLRDGCP